MLAIGYALAAIDLWKWCVDLRVVFHLDVASKSKFHSYLYTVCCKCEAIASTFAKSILWNVMCVALMFLVCFHSTTKIISHERQILAKCPANAHHTTHFNYCILISFLMEKLHNTKKSVRYRYNYPFRISLIVFFFFYVVAIVSVHVRRWENDNHQKWEWFRGKIAYENEANSKNPKVCVSIGNFFPMKLIHRVPRG